MYFVDYCSDCIIYLWRLVVQQGIAYHTCMNHFSTLNLFRLFVVVVVVLCIHSPPDDDSSDDDDEDEEEAPPQIMMRPAMGRGKQLRAPSPQRDDDDDDDDSDSSDESVPHVPVGSGKRLGAMSGGGKQLRRQS